MNMQDARSKMLYRRCTVTSNGFFLRIGNKEKTISALGDSNLKMSSRIIRNKLVSPRQISMHFHCY